LKINHSTIEQPLDRLEHQDGMGKGHGSLFERLTHILPASINRRANTDLQQTSTPRFEA
jgi:hypothetical protein